MNNLLDIKTPAQDQAAHLKSDYGLDNHGLTNLRLAYWNLPSEALYEEAVFRREGRISHEGPLVVNTGKHTARSATDKFIVREPSTEDNIWWGDYNRPISAAQFSETYNRLQGFMQSRDLFVQDCYIGADAEYHLPARIITEAILGYLGLGMRPSTDPTAFFITSWGSLMLEGQTAINAQPWILLAPAICVSLVVLAFTFLGDGLRDAFDPRQRNT